MRVSGLALCSVLAPPLSYAAPPVAGPYVSLGAGVNLQQNEIVAPAPSLGFDNNVIYTFHPGFAGEASAGYGLGNGFRLELEGDYLSNVVRGAKGETNFGTNPPRRAGGEEKKYGGFVNVLFDLDISLPVSPYLGIGAGGQAVEHRPFSQNAIGVTPLPLSDGGTRSFFHDQTVGGFAYQGIAGVSVPIPFVPGLSFTADYRFMGLLDPLPAFQLTTQRQVLVLAPPTTRARYEIVQSTGNRHFTNDLNHQVILGFRYALFQPASPLPAAAAATAQPAAPAPEPSRTYLVFFDWDRADLTGRARQIVAEAAQASTHVQTTRIEVNGYTDLSGTAAYNQRLSVRRAQSVEAELVRDGVARGEITIHGFGESNPLVQTAKGVREPQNRRVEIVLR